MSHKPGILIVISLVAFLTIGFSGCEDPHYVAIRGIEQAEVLNLHTKTIVEQSSSTDSDSLALVVTLETVSFSLNHHMPGIMHEAWAFYPTMANEIVDIRIYCNKPIYDIPAGSNLAEELLYRNYDYTKSLLDQFIQNLPRKGDNDYLDQIYIYLLSKPSPGFYEFIIEIEDNNGHVFSAVTPQFEWL